MLNLLLGLIFSIPLLTGATESSVNNSTDGGLRCSAAPGSILSTLVGREDFTITCNDERSIAQADKLRELDNRLMVIEYDFEIIASHIGRRITKQIYMHEGWMESRNFLFKKFDGYEDYKTARSRCQGFGGRLATEILRHSETVKFIITSKYIGAYPRQPWIGYDDMETEGSWVWADGGVTDSETTEWNTDEPNSYQGQEEDCGQLVDSTEDVVRMNDQPCTERQTYICEINLDNF